MPADMPLEDVVRVAERLLRDVGYNVECLVDYEGGTWSLVFKAKKGEKEVRFVNKKPDLADLINIFRWWYACVWGIDLNEVIDDVIRMEGDDDG
ncbi:MAG: hypothetical protein QXI60_11705 [Thermofilaceae archaeon]